MAETLPPRAPQSRAFPLPSTPDRVELRLRLQPIETDVLDDLVDSGDLDPAVRDAMPTFDIDLGDGPVLRWSAETASVVQLRTGEASCVTQNRDVDAAQ